MIVPTHILSSNINAIGYKKGTMYVRFNYGPVYAYTGVPFKIFAELRDAESAGIYFNSNVKGVFPYRRMQEDPFYNAVKKAA